MAKKPDPTKIPHVKRTKDRFQHVSTQQDRMFDKAEEETNKAEKKRGYSLQALRRLLHINRK